MFLVDTLHQRGIGVILDWVPAHFPRDEHGLAYFDGTHLYEHADPRPRRASRLGHVHLQLRPQRGPQLPHHQRRCSGSTSTTSTACAWTPSPRCSISITRARRANGSPTSTAAARTWTAIAFLRRLNEHVYGAYPGVADHAEESTAWPVVSRPTYLGGLGFGFKWDMGWMHDTLDYIAPRPRPPQATTTTSSPSA